MMKLAKRAAALVLAAVLALSLTACSPKEAASNLILKTADLLGLREEGSVRSSSSPRSWARAKSRSTTSAWSS